MRAPALLSWLLPLVAAVSSVRGSAQQPGPSAPASSPVAVNPPSIAAGKDAFRKYCRPCHGDDAKGNGPLAARGTEPPDLTDAVWAHGATDGEIYASIRDGIGPKMDMKGFKSKLTDREIWSVVNYLRSIGPGSR